MISRSNITAYTEKPMSRLVLASILGLLLAGCAGRERPPGGVIVDMKGVDRAQYQADLTECEQYADQVDVAGQAAAGAVGGAVVGGLIGAVVDDAAPGRGAAVGGIAGGATGTVKGIEERQVVIKNCLRNRGYAVLN